MQKPEIKGIKIEKYTQSEGTKGGWERSIYCNAVVNLQCISFLILHIIRFGTKICSFKLSNHM